MSREQRAKKKVNRRHEKVYSIQKKTIIQQRKKDYREEKYLI